MIPATQTLICPHCRQKYCYKTLISGNTIGAIYYSDAKCDAPMLPSSISIFKCSKCKKFVWVEDMKEAGTLSMIVTSCLAKIKRLVFKGEMSVIPGFFNHDWCNLDRSCRSKGSPMQPLSLQELAEALVANVAKNKDHERHLRFALWWLFNDRIRKLDKPTESQLWENEDEKKLWYENLNALFILLDTTNVNDQLVQAEVCRECGDFEKAIKLLDYIQDTRLEPFVKAIRKRCQDGVPFVFLIEREDEK